MPGRRIVLTTFGSLGDLHPLLAVALGLKERGHRPLLVTQVEHKAKVDAVGVEVAPLRPGLSDLGERNELLRRIMDQRTGSEFIIRSSAAPRRPNPTPDRGITASARMINAAAICSRARSLAEAL